MRRVVLPADHPARGSGRPTHRTTAAPAHNKENVMATTRIHELFGRAPDDGQHLARIG
jgi:hypothetical protein